MNDSVWTPGSHIQEERRVVLGLLGSLGADGTMKNADDRVVPGCVTSIDRRDRQIWRMPACMVVSFEQLLLILMLIFIDRDL